MADNNTLQALINSAAIGETIVLSSDVILTSKVTVSKEVTIDLNGYTINGDIDGSYGAIYVNTKGVLTIKDSSPAQTGKISNALGHAIGNYGTVNIYGGAFVGNYALYNFYYDTSTYGKSTIYDGTFKSVDDNAPSIANCGKLTVNGGTIESIDTTNVLTVAGGTVESLYVGVADYNPEKQDTSINGGHIVDFAVADGSNNKVVVSGGTFDVAIDKQYLADGVKLTYNESTGTYGATVSQGLKVIATTSSRIRQLPIKNGQLIFIQDLKRIAFDFNNTRVFYNQITELDTEFDRSSLKNPLNGYYFVIGSCRLWVYKDGWTPITERPETIEFIDVELPELGQEDKLYVNKTEQNISVWDDDTNKYVCIANYIEDVADEDILNLF